MLWKHGFAIFTSPKLRVELRCKLQEKLHRVTGPLDPSNLLDPQKNDLKSPIGKVDTNGTKFQKYQ